MEHYGVEPRFPHTLSFREEAEMAFTALAMMSHLSKEQVADAIIHHAWKQGRRGIEEMYVEYVMDKAEEEKAHHRNK